MKEAPEELTIAKEIYDSAQRLKTGSKEIFNLAKEKYEINVNVNIGAGLMAISVIVLTIWLYKLS